MQEEVDPLKALELAIASLDRQYGKNTVVRLGEQDVEPWPSISTTAINLDKALGIGGLPKGRVVEVYGPASAGKTTLALTVVGQAQRDGDVCAFVDIEHALDPAYAQILGVNLDDLLISQPNNGEEALEIVDTLTRTGALRVIVIDSVAALVPKAELEGEMGDHQMGSQARLMSQAMRKLVGLAAKNNTMLIFINQLRSKVGVIYGSPETTSGGNALKFYSSIRIDIRRMKDVVNSKTGLQEGLRVKVKIVKNKLAPPYRTCEFEILYGRGINTMGCVVESAVDAGLFTFAGSWINYKGETFAQGKDKAVERLASDLDLVEIIKKELDGSLPEL